MQRCFEIAFPSTTKAAPVSIRWSTPATENTPQWPSKSSCTLLLFAWLSTVPDVRTSTGTTGYIGGDALYAIHKAHPDWAYTALVRTKDKGSKLQQAYPNVNVVYGDLDSYDLIKQEAAKADIVVRK